MHGNAIPRSATTHMKSATGIIPHGVLTPNAEYENENNEDKKESLIARIVNL
jgi:hypothetical protein